MRTVVYPSDVLALTNRNDDYKMNFVLISAGDVSYYSLPRGLNGLAGNDTLQALSPTVIIDGESYIKFRGENFLYNGAFLSGGYGNDVVYGGTGDDTLRGDEGNDFLSGGAGNDALEGGEGNDTLDGGSGNDTLAGSGFDILRGGDGNDSFDVRFSFGETGKVDGGKGSDHVNLNGHAVGAKFTSIEFAHLGITSVSSSQLNSLGKIFADYTSDITMLSAGTVGPNFAATAGGKYHSGQTASITGSLGADTIDLAGVSVSWYISDGEAEDEGASNDSLIGGSADDWLTAWGGDDILRGNKGNDFLRGGNGNDLLEGGAGNDVLEGGEGTDTLDGGSGNDTLAGSGFDILRGGDGNDSFDVRFSFGETGKVDGGKGSDHVNLNGHAVGAKFTSIEFAHLGITSVSSSQLNSLGKIFADYTSDITMLSAGTVGPNFAATAGGKYHSGQTASITGSLGADTIDLAGVSVSWYISDGETEDEGASNDSLIGGSADDWLTAWGGDDILRGNKGNDFLRGGDGNDVLDGGAGADSMDGGLGNDIYYINNPGDRIIEVVNLGVDTLYTSINYTLSDNLNIETLRASAGTLGIKIAGNKFTNTLVGGEGDDVLIGGSGRDILVGGAGSDTFTFRSIRDSINGSAGRDQVSDFLTGTDRIDLSAIQANTSASSDKPFNYIGSGAFTKSAGELHAIRSGSSTIIEGDVTGDGKTDFQIVLRGIVDVLQTSDFVL